MVSMHSKNPSLYQINTRVWLKSLTVKYGKSITLANIPEDELHQLVELGFEWIWLLGVWRTGTLGEKIAREKPELRQSYHEAIPEYQESDICSSPFAVTGYTVSPHIGGDPGLAIFRDRLHQLGFRLMLDFVPNHTARDHPWLTLHPEYYVPGDQELILSQPFNYGRTKQGNRIIAFGRDPYFPGWSDTFQLNYSNPGLQFAMQEELLRVAEFCDGVRCDMAMLILPEVFYRTWGLEMQPFWPETISKVREKHPEFTFMAEVYWDLEWTLQQQGFDYTYDKRLYDRLQSQEARSVREHLFADLDFQIHSVRFLENHDEPRAARTFPLDVHQSAAWISYLVPGLRFFHQGQLQGFHTWIPMQICRSPGEDPDLQITSFYEQVLELLRNPILRNGRWQLLDCLPAWQSNWTWDSFIAFAWQDDQGHRLLVITNYSPHQSQCYVSLPWSDLQGKLFEFKDLISEASYLREGDDLHEFGLYIDIPAWKTHVFEVHLR